MGVFCQNLVYNLEDYHNFKNVFLNNGIILEINFYYRTRGNVSFIELSEKKKKLSQAKILMGWVNLISWRTSYTCRRLPKVELVYFKNKIMIFLEEKLLPKG